jgi:hypothetical protein
MSDLRCKDSPELWGCCRRPRRRTRTRPRTTSASECGVCREEKTTSRNRRSAPLRDSVGRRRTRLPKRRNHRRRFRKSPASAVMLSTERQTPRNTFSGRILIRKYKCQIFGLSAVSKIGTITTLVQGCQINTHIHISSPCEKQWYCDYNLKNLAKIALVFLYKASKPFLLIAEWIQNVFFNMP